MKEIQYRAFSLRTHEKNLLSGKPNVCQFELTFKCHLHCRHCYTACYNKPGYFKKELDTKQVKLILDKIYKAGVVWVCFTGGDPLTRSDFLEIYAYAKRKGFIVTIFTNAYSMSSEIAGYFKQSPPFSIEITLNAATENLYEKISQVKGSFARAMQGIDLILKKKLPLKIKTQITRDNLKELALIKKFLQERSLGFWPSFDLFSQLNGDLSPNNSRSLPNNFLNLDKNKQALGIDCRLSEPSDTGGRNGRLFHCAIGSKDSIHIDPYGNLLLCNLIRRPVFNLFEVDIMHALEKSALLVKDKNFTTNSKCKTCSLRESCLWCPGKAYIETGSMEAPIKYYCELAKIF